MQRIHAAATRGVIYWVLSGLVKNRFQHIKINLELVAGTESGPGAALPKKKKIKSKDRIYTWETTFKKTA